MKIDLASSLNLPTATPRIVTCSRAETRLEWDACATCAARYSAQCDAVTATVPTAAAPALCSCVPGRLRYAIYLGGELYHSVPVGDGRTGAAHEASATAELIDDLLAYLERKDDEYHPDMDYYDAADWALWDRHQAEKERARALGLSGARLDAILGWGEPPRAAAQKRAVVRLMIQGACMLPQEVVDVASWLATTSPTEERAWKLIDWRWRMYLLAYDAAEYLLHLYNQCPPDGPLVLSARDVCAHIDRLPEGPYTVDERQFADLALLIAGQRYGLCADAIQITD